MTKNRIKTFLLANPGYLKKSSEWLRLNKFRNISLGQIDKALKEIKSYDYSVSVIVDKTFVKNQTKKIKVEWKEVIFDNRRLIPGTYYVTGCSHAPWHNKKMYDSVFNYLSKEVKLQGLILAGDIADLNSLSSHDKGKIPISGVTLDWEYKQVNKFLDEFDDLDIKGTKDFLYGNHCDRYNRAIKDVDTAKYGKSLISPIEGLNLLERGYRVYDNWKSDNIQLGKYLEVNHGEFLNVHSAKKTIDTYRSSVLYFHTHRFQVYVEGLVGGWNMGSGADFNAPVFNYATRAMKTSWVNSSCLVTIDNDGYYHVEPLMWINNQLMVNGKKY